MHACKITFDNRTHQYRLFLSRQKNPMFMPIKHSKLMLNPSCNNPCRVIFSPCSWHAVSMWILRSLCLATLLLSLNGNLVYPTWNHEASSFFLRLAQMRKTRKSIKRQLFFSQERNYSERKKKNLGGKKAPGQKKVSAPVFLFFCCVLNFAEHSKTVVMLPTLKVHNSTGPHSFNYL